MRRITKAALTLATAVSTAAPLSALAAAPASAKPYPPPSIHLLCTAANGGRWTAAYARWPPESPPRPTVTPRPSR